MNLMLFRTIELCRPNSIYLEGLIGGMYSSEDLERFYFQYQTEGVPKRISIQSFCLKNQVPYNLFSK